MLIQVAGVWKTIICFSWQVKHMNIFYRNSSVPGFQWDESEVIRRLPVQRRVPEVFEKEVYEKRDIYTGVLKFRAFWVVLEFANVHLQSTRFPLPSVNFMFADTTNLWINKTFLMGKRGKSLLYWSLKFAQAPTKATPSVPFPWVEIKTRRGHSLITITGKIDSIWGHWLTKSEVGKK